MFEEQVPVNEIANQVGVTVDTVRRYHQQWQKNPNFEQQYIYLKGLIKKTAPDRERTIELIASGCGIPQEQLETILLQPHGLRRLMMGKFYFPAHANADHKKYVALELAILISEYLEKNGGKYEDVYFAFQRWMQENKKYREERDSDIAEENRAIAFTRKVIEAAVMQEQQGNSKPDKLSEEERNSILKYGINARKRKLEKSYWQRIAALIAGGLTPEQAREKIYQDLIEKGDLNGAKLVQEYQNAVHPLKTIDQQPPPLSPEPPSPA
jgi:predicted transcriptional regulator